jgi:hypothetical protein
LQHLSSINYGSLGIITYSSLGSNEAVQAASVVLGFVEERRWARAQQPKTAALQLLRSLTATSPAASSA